jgi:hypothetical protein
MTAIEISVPPLAREIYAILKDAKDWLTLREIAGYLQRKNGKPLPGDRGAVRLLVECDLVEIQERTRGAAQTYFVYRAKAE